jgi:7,8-dihydroneopterin aldolase/epimerase/oxygenase
MKGNIVLKDLEFHAYHGVYPEERSNGQKFLINLTIHTDIQAAAQSDDIHQALNYVDVYNLVAEEMTKPSNLLEHVVHRIASRLKSDFPSIEGGEISITKAKPPIDGALGGITVQLIL